MSSTFYLVRNVSCKNPWDNKVVISKDDFMSKTEEFARFNVRIVEEDTSEKVSLWYSATNGESPHLDVFFSRESAEIQEFCSGRGDTSLSSFKPLLTAVMCVLGYPIIDEQSIEVTSEEFLTEVA